MGFSGWLLGCQSWLQIIFKRVISKIRSKLPYYNYIKITIILYVHGKNVYAAIVRILLHTIFINNCDTDYIWWNNTVPHTNGQRSYEEINLRLYRTYVKIVKIQPDLYFEGKNLIRVCLLKTYSATNQLVLYSSYLQVRRKRIIGVPVTIIIVQY